MMTASRERTGPPPRLLDVQRPSAKRGHSLRTILAYLDWTTGFILLHGKRHPRDLTNAEVGRFLGHVAQRDKGGCSPGDRGQRATGERRGRTATLPRKLFGNRSFGNNQCHRNATVNVLPRWRGQFA